VVPGVHEVLSDRDGETARMTKALTVEEATKALDEAIAKQKAAHKAAADMYGDVVAAREALDAAFLAEDELMPQCTVSSVGGIPSVSRLHKMVVLERRKDVVKCRMVGSRGSYIPFLWRHEEQSYVAIRGVGGHLGIHRSIVSFDDEPMRGSENPVGEATA